MAATRKTRTRQISRSPKRSRVYTAAARKIPEREGLAGVPYPGPILALPHVMELIDAFRMTPEEAAWHAATRGHSEWLGKIISSDGINVTSLDMLVVAAGKGYDEVVKLLLPALLDFRHEKCYDRWEATLSAVETASASGHYSTLNILLPELHVGGGNQEVACTAVFDKVLDKAAERGSLDAVTAIVKHAEEESYAYTLGDGCRSLSRAAAGGHTDLVEFMVKLNKWYWKWDLPHAVAAAVKANQTEIATKLYGENPEYGKKKKNLFVCLARDGYTGAVEYFFPKVRSCVAVLKEALLAAAKRDQSGTVAFLLGTKCIPSEATEQAFGVAAGNAARSVMQYLLDQCQLAPETIDKGFISASEGGHYDLMQSLYAEQQISADAVLDAFIRTSVFTDIKTLKCLIRLLSDETRIPREFKHKAFVEAALTGKVKALQQFTMRGHDELPLDVLKRAHSTTLDNTKKIVRRVTCEQLFNSSPKGRFDAVAKVMAEWKKETTEKKRSSQRKRKRT